MPPSRVKPCSDLCVAEQETCKKHTAWLWGLFLFPAYTNCALPTQGATSLAPVLSGPVQLTRERSPNKGVFLKLLWARRTFTSCLTPLSKASPERCLAN